MVSREILLARQLKNYANLKKFKKFKKMSNENNKKKLGKTYCLLINTSFYKFISYFLLKSKLINF
jgi:hypothetical protein